MLLSWVIIFLIVTLIAGVFGFSGIAADSAWIAKVLFLLSLIQRMGWVDHFYF